MVRDLAGMSQCCDGACFLDLCLCVGESPEDGAPRSQVVCGRNDCRVCFEDCPGDRGRAGVADIETCGDSPHCIQSHDRYRAVGCRPGKEQQVSHAIPASVTWGADGRFSMRENARDAPQGLVGSWRLASYEDRPAAGPAVFPYGTEPKGFLVYDATGHITIQIMKQPHPKVASGDPYRVTPQEKEALLDAYAAYFGTYRVDATRGIVVHHAEGDLYGLFIGRDEERPFELTGDRLVLKPLWSKDGQKWSGIRVFERVK